MKGLRERRSSSRLQQELYTGITWIDDYLKELDTHLAGSRSVRRVTLYEARETLLEAYEKAPVGSADDAGAEAARVYGDAESVGSTQRAERRSVFFSSFWRLGLTFAGLILVYDIFSGDPASDGWTSVLGRFAFNGVFFGFFMALFSAYGTGYANHRTETFYDPDAPYIVEHKRSGRVYAWIILAVFGVMLAIAVTGANGIGPLQGESLPANIFLATLCAYLALFAVHELSFRTIVDHEYIKIHRYVSRITVPRSNITRVRQLPGWYALLPFVSGPAYRLHWQDEDGTARRTPIGLDGELKNSRRLEKELQQLCG